MKISGNEIRVGMLIEHKNDLWQVLKTQHVKPGKGGAFAQVEMKSINRNTKLNERFRSSDAVEKASLDEIKFSYLYEDEDDYYFINPKIGIFKSSPAIIRFGFLILLATANSLTVTPYLFAIFPKVSFG